MIKITTKFLVLAIMLIAIQITLTAQPIGTQIKTDTSGHISYWNGVDAWIAIAPGLPGQTLIFTAGVPSWVNNPNGITSTIVSNFTTTSAVSGGNILSDGGAKIIAKGVCWSTSTNPTIADSITINGTGIESFTTNITGLAAGTTYFVRAYATNSFGTAYGNEISFTSLTTIPSLTTTSATAITSTTAITGGNISSDGGAAVIARGVCWSTSANPTVALSSKTTDGTGTGNFTSNITGLTSSTTYYIRAYATNNAGTSYGNELILTTIAPQTVTDYDGNIYDIVTIGAQVWMKQNLKTTHYKNGTAITYPGADNTAWINNTTGAYAWYNNNEATYKITYGALYNWYAVNTGNLCPTGWHVPTDDEWTILTIYLGGESIAGGKLKSTTLWNNPNTGATNETGFTALPGGEYYVNYSYFGIYGNWWSSSVYNTTYAWKRYINSNNSIIYKGTELMKIGVSVRCLRDIGAQASLPTLITTEATTITSTTAYSVGNITVDGGAAVTARGICWSTTSNPTVALSTKTNEGTGIGYFTSIINGLAPGTTYFVRAYATNSEGTAYGNELSFTTQAIAVFDIDGNGYDTVQIGTQVWLKQNLNTSRYNNGIVIPNVTNNATWSILTTGARCYYNNDSISNASTYGALYNWKAVNSGNLCPTGWHVPTDTEWTTLTTYLGGESIAGGKLKATTLWASSNNGATNSSGFTALPGGYRNPPATFNNIGYYGNWWSSSEYNTANSWCRYIYCNEIKINRYNRDNDNGYSVRCIKD